MVGKKRKPSSRPPAPAAGFVRDPAKDQETIRIVNDLLDAKPVDMAMLRKVSAVRGLVNDQLRRRAWPRLLEVDVSTADIAEYKRQFIVGLLRPCKPHQFAVNHEHMHGTRKRQLLTFVLLLMSWRVGYSEEEHRDTGTVQVDVERSLWAFTTELSDEAREEKRQALQRLINGVVGKHSGKLYYYQGFHDIASVLLLVLGENAAYPLLEKIALHFLSECMAPDLQSVMRRLEMLPRLLTLYDEELAEYLASSSAPPYFAITWPLTWFAHDINELEVAARLFDLFLASEPLMPLYVGAVAMHAARDDILALECEAAYVHAYLKKMPLLRHLTADELAQHAVMLYRQFPPAQLESAAQIASRFSWRGQCNAQVVVVLGVVLAVIGGLYMAVVQ
eukprot:jgi/Chlat1/6525/Chrsp45S06004